MMFNDAVYVGRECPFCGEYHEVLVSEADYAAWQGGELVQNAFPYLSADEREILVSGICSECWGKEDDVLEEDWWGDDPNWGYNEDMGYDPYMGCYTDDC